MLNALTVDVEDFFQVSAYEKIVRLKTGAITATAL